MSLPAEKNIIFYLPSCYSSVSEQSDSVVIIPIYIWDIFKLKKWLYNQ